MFSFREAWRLWYTPSEKNVSLNPEARMLASSYFRGRTLRINDNLPTLVTFDEIIDSNNYTLAGQVANHLPLVQSQSHRDVEVL
jgi:hypothetical protein